MTYILAIDQGTSSTRAVIYDCLGKMHACAQYPITTYYPHPEWVEQDPEEIWAKTLRAIQDVIARVGAHNISACGITNQRETTVIWDKKTGKCLAPAVVWQDRRTAAFCASLSSHATMIYDKTGLFPDPYFSASKLHWLLQHIPDAHSYAEQNRLAFGTIDSFLIWRLTEGVTHATDVTNAARTLLFNIHSKCWDNDLLELFNVPSSILPVVQSCDAYYGVINKSLLSVDIPIYGVIGDQQAGMLGQGCLSSGMMKATYGTGGFLMLHTGHETIDTDRHLLTTIAYQIKQETAYALEGTIYHAGTSVQWLCQSLQLMQDPQEVETLACSIDDNEGVYFLPAFTGLGAPHWISAHGAMVVGIKRNTHKAHFARAALESTCYQTYDILSIMRQCCRTLPSIIRVDGGMAHNAWFLQFLASLCELEVQRPLQIESTSLGAALLAGIGVGMINDLHAIEAQWAYEQRWFAAHDQAVMQKNYQGWLDAMARLR